MSSLRQLIVEGEQLEASDVVNFIDSVKSIEEIPEDIQECILEIAQYGWTAEQIKRAYSLVREQFGVDNTERPRTALESSTGSRLTRRFEPIQNMNSCLLRIARHEWAVDQVERAYNLVMEHVGATIAGFSNEPKWFTNEPPGANDSPGPIGPESTQLRVSTAASFQDFNAQSQNEKSQHNMTTVFPAAAKSHAQIEVIDRTAAEEGLIEVISEDLDVSAEFCSQAEHRERIIPELAYAVYCYLQASKFSSDEVWITEIVRRIGHNASCRIIVCRLLDKILPNNATLNSEPVAQETMHEKMDRMFTGGESHDHVSGHVGLASTPNFSEKADFRLRFRRQLWYPWMVSRVTVLLRTSMSFRFGWTPLEIRSKMDQVPYLSQTKQTAVFSLHDWDPLKFIQEEYTDAVKLSNVIVLTAYWEDAQATTCEAYMLQTWPLTGLSTLGALEDAMQSGFSSSVQYSVPHGSLCFHLTDRGLQVTAALPGLILTEIAEQLCWLSAACRSATGPDKVEYFSARVTHVSTPQQTATTSSVSGSPPFSRSAFSFTKSTPAAPPDTLSTSPHTFPLASSNVASRPDVPVPNDNLDFKVDPNSLQVSQEDAAQPSVRHALRKQREIDGTSMQPLESERKLEAGLVASHSDGGSVLDSVAGEIFSGTKGSRKRIKTGCLTCRKRRIKCGEEHPVCRNCINSRRHCEGYAAPLSFPASPIHSQKNTTHVAHLYFEIKVQKSRHHRYPSTDLSTTARADCWKSLFRNPAIADDFPVSVRPNDEKGLEMPLSMMASMVDADSASCFNGQLLIKGFNAMLVPTLQKASSVVWHLLHNADQSRLPFTAAWNEIRERVSIELSSLTQSRHFVGWTPSADMLTGTRNCSYDIERTKARLATQSRSAPQTASIVRDKAVFGGPVFVKGNKDRPLWMSQGGSYRQKIHFLSKSYAVLYDDSKSDKRGWLVTGADAMVHLLRAQLNVAPYCESEHLRIDDFVHASVGDRSAAAKKALLDEKNMNLIWDKEDELSQETKIVDGRQHVEIKTTTRVWTVKHLVERLWHTMEQMYDHQGMETLAVRHGFSRGHLEGWSFREIIEDDQHLSPRVVALGSAGRSWVDMVRGIGAITIFGRGFGDLIVPTACTEVCPRWKTVPTGCDYLTACVSTLQAICDKYGDDEAEPFELTRENHWYQGDALFGKCENPTDSDSVCCDRVQIVLPVKVKMSSKKARSPKPFDHPLGAVIFGRSESLPFYWPLRGPPLEGCGPREDDDSGIGSSLTTTETSSSRSASTANEIRGSIAKVRPDFWI